MSNKLRAVFIWGFTWSLSSGPALFNVLIFSKINKAVERMLLQTAGLCERLQSVFDYYTFTLFNNLKNSVAS